MCLQNGTTRIRHADIVLGQQHANELCNHVFTVTLRSTETAQSEWMLTAVTDAIVGELCKLKTVALSVYTALGQSASNVMIKIINTLSNVFK